MTPERLAEIESLLDVPHCGGFTHEQALECRAAIYDLIEALHEAQTQVLELRDSQSARRLEEMREALRMAQTAIGLLDEQVNEAEQAGYRRGVEAGIVVAAHFENLHVCSSCGLTDEEESERWAVKNAGKEMRVRLEALLPPDATETSENPLP